MRPKFLRSFFDRGQFVIYILLAELRRDFLLLSQDLVTPDRVR